MLLIILSYFICAVSAVIATNAQFHINIYIMIVSASTNIVAAHLANAKTLSRTIAQAARLPSQTSQESV